MPGLLPPRDSNFGQGAWLGRDLEYRLGGADHRAEALGGLIGQADPNRAAAGFIERLRDLLAQGLGSARVKLDGHDRHPALTEIHRLGTGVAELDPGVLEAYEVVQLFRHGSEAILQLFAEHDQLRYLACAR